MPAFMSSGVLLLQGKNQPSRAKNSTALQKVTELFLNTRKFKSPKDVLENTRGFIIGQYT